jgi:hypothetical protein
MTTKNLKANATKAKTELGVSIKIIIIAVLFGGAAILLQDALSVVNEEIVVAVKLETGLGILAAGAGVTVSKLWLTVKPKKKKTPEVLR